MASRHQHDVPSGTIGFPVTPWDSDLNLDENGLRAHAERMVESNLDALTFCGSNGELHSLALDEYERITEIAGDVVGSRAYLIFGVGQSWSTARKQVALAVRAGARAILCVAPYMTDRSIAGLADYYRSVADTAGVSVILYQTKWSGTLPLELLERLERTPNICMVKDEHGDLSHYLNVRRHFKDRFHWINGMAEPYVPSYWNLGVETFTSGLACFMPQVTLRIRDLAQAGDFEGINRVLDDLIIPMYALRNRRPGYKVSMIKSAMALAGNPAGRRSSSDARDGQDRPPGPLDPDEAPRPADGIGGSILKALPAICARALAGAALLATASDCRLAGQDTATKDAGATSSASRQIAPTMSYVHADWLTRPEREQEEQPDRLLASLQIPRGSTVIDFGAGVGYFTWRLAQQVGPRGRVLAVDIQPEMLDMLTENMQKRGMRNVETILSTNEDSGLSTNAADLALLVDVYHELTYPARTMAEVRDALKPEGRLVVVEYRKEDPRIPIHPLHKMTAQEVRDEIEPIGFDFVERLDFLPRQHVLIFTPSKEER